MKKQEEQDTAKHFNKARLQDDEDFQLFRILLNKLKERYHLPAADLINKLKQDISIPCSIFNKKLSPLETEVKYMKENLDYSYKKIAALLGRSDKTVWQAYKNAVKKLPEKLKAEETRYNIPVSALNTNLSILESTVTYLKDNYDLSYHDIGDIIQRDEKTIWTVHNRAKNKLKTAG
ncbi:hypothetical protein GF336_02135 [Candidatus Woesearchaeota archaeon]|nr:hypothetical protein [Candidatus Woesearchaeota archaeon]